jgi:hypothetical protein
MKGTVGSYLLTTVHDQSVTTASTRVSDGMRGFSIGL